MIIKYGIPILSILIILSILLIYFLFFRNVQEKNQEQEQNLLDKNFYMNKLVTYLQETIGSYDNKYFDPLLISSFQKQNELSVFKITIRNGKIEITNLITYNEPEQYINHLKKTLKKLENSYCLPNCTFLLTLNDTEIKSEFPIFTNSCHVDHKKKVLLHPNWFFYSQENIKEAIQDKTPWDVKIDKAVWRGSDSNRIKKYGTEKYTSRTYIVNTGMENEENFDTGFYKFEESNKKKMKHFKLKNFLSPSEQCKYKYIISTDGYGGTHGLYWELSSNSCVINKSLYNQWFSIIFNENEDFIPYDDTEENENLDKVVENLINNENLAKITAQDSHNTAKIIFTEDFVLEYFYQMIKIYAYKQNLYFIMN